METGTIRDSLEIALSNNGAIHGHYRELARRSGERFIAGLAATAAAQRQELADELKALQGSLGAERGKLASTLPQRRPEIAKGAGGEDAKAVLAWILEAERADEGCYSSLAESAGRESELGLRFTTMAEQARKRADRAKDHLDLLSLR